MLLFNSSLSSKELDLITKMQQLMSGLEGELAEGSYVYQCSKPQKGISVNRYLLTCKTKASTIAYNAC